jgi:hypothetical protein
MSMWNRIEGWLAAAREDRESGEHAAPRMQGQPRNAARWRRTVHLATLLSLLAGSVDPLSAQGPSEPTPAGRPGPGRPEQKFRDFGEVVKDAKKYDGLFTLYQDEDHLFAEIKPGQFNQMYLAPIAIARGMASAGVPLNFGDEWILSFRRVGDKVQLVRRNIYYEAPPGSPLAKAVEQNYSDSVLLALPIVTINPGTQGVLIDFSNIFLNDFAGLGLGPMDRNRSRWHKIKTFENNVELEVEATFGIPFGGGRGASFGDEGVVDGRGVTVVVHYSLAKRPEPGYRPRFADQRVGHFISATKDFSSSNPDTTFVRRINRWRLEKANPQMALSPPKKQIVWWVENTVPHEYRPYVEDGILEWNKAFEKIGFRNAIGVRWQNEQDEFDPEDINYCTFRWIATPRTYAMSGLRADPITGEIIDGDVIFDASWIRAWKSEYALEVGQPPVSQGSGEPTGPSVLRVGEVISPILAARQGFGANVRLPHAADPTTGLAPPQWVPADRSPLQMLLAQRLTSCNHMACEYAAARSQEYSLAAMALAARAIEAAALQTGDQTAGNQPAGGLTSEDKPAGDKPVEAKLPEELIGQAIKEVVMHEVGHSLGLRHNFRASTMLSLEDLNNTDLTRSKGMVGSVMDYNPLNVARKGQKQGDYATTTIGPYDYWAIEYGYSPIQGDEQAELKRIASRSPESDLAYGTDEDLSLSNDPLVNAYDLGNDPLRYGKDRIALAGELLQTLDATVVRDGESWARLRRAFSVLLSQYGNAAALATPYIGGQNFSRDFKGGEKSRDPVTPIAGEKQREALNFLVGEILSDKSFQFSPALLRRLTTEYWYHWGSDSLGMAGSVDYNINDRILRIQQVVLGHCFDASVLSRLENQQLMVKPEDKPLTIAELFRTLNDGVWSELPKDGKAEKVQVSLVRRNLQRDHLRRLCQMMLGSGSGGSQLASFVVLLGGGGEYPADARSLARTHLKELDSRLQAVLENQAVQMDDATRAHFAESRDLVTKVLNAQFEARRP